MEKCNECGAQIESGFTCMGCGYKYCDGCEGDIGFCVDCTKDNEDNGF